MGTYINYIFTQEPIKELSDRGFMIQSIDRSEDEGYISWQIIFQNDVVYELREILDEDIYLQKYKIKRFEPRFVSEKPLLTFPAVTHPNGILGLVDPSENARVLEEGPLRDYLKWRKPSLLKGLTFECRDLNYLNQVAHPEKKFSINEGSYSLIHLGPNCIDLIVRQRKS